MFHRRYIFKWWISHCYVSLPECTFPETNSSNPKIDGWKMILSFLACHLFRCHISCREDMCFFLINCLMPPEWVIVHTFIFLWKLPFLKLTWLAPEIINGRKMNPFLLGLLLFLSGSVTRCGFCCHFGTEIQLVSILPTVVRPSSRLASLNGWRIPSQRGYIGAIFTFFRLDEPPQTWLTPN